MGKLGLAFAAAVLGLTMAGTGAAADPVETTDPTATAPSSPEPPPVVTSVGDLELTATFDKPSYASGEVMTITVTVTNTGTEQMTTQLAFDDGRPDSIQVADISPIPLYQSFTVAGGASVTLTVTASMSNPNVRTATLYVSLVDQTGLAKPFSFDVPVTPTFGHASGVVFYDKNRNHTFDEGEGQRGVTLTWYSPHPSLPNQTVTTDANGRFRLEKLPAGSYDVVGEGLGGLKVGRQRVVVGESGVDGLLFRGAAPLHGLFAKVEFTKDIYTPDESPTVRVTLTNSSDLTISGLTANCSAGGDPTSLTGTTDGWGDLVRDGVDLAPRSTTTFDVTEPMPPHSHSLGVVMVACEFGYPDVESSYNPYSMDRAAVPGLRGDVVGVVTKDDVGLAGVRLWLVPDVNFMPYAPCGVTAEATTGPDGTFAFRQVPVGMYYVDASPPPGLRIEHPTFTRVDVYGGRVSELNVTVAPGEEKEPVLPACPSANTGPGPTQSPAGMTAPAPRARTATALADTGVRVLEPAVAGLLAVLAGTGMVLLSRRRRPADEG